MLEPWLLEMRGECGRHKASFANAKGVESRVKYPARAVDRFRGGTSKKSRVAVGRFPPAAVNGIFWYEREL